MYMHIRTGTFISYTVRYTVLHARRGYVPLQSFYAKMKNVAMNIAVEERQKVLVAFTYKTQNIKRLFAAITICKFMNRNIWHMCNTSVI